MEGGSVTTPYTLKKLTEVEDSAPKFGYGELQEARFATGDLDATETGVSLHRVKPGKRQGFAHKHDEAEEVYVVIGGSGRVKLDDEIVEIERLVGESRLLHLAVTESGSGVLDLTQLLVRVGIGHRYAASRAGSACRRSLSCSDLASAAGSGCSTVRATTIAATTRPAAIQNARW